MFWGLVVQPNKKYSKTVSTPFHVSQAVLDVTNTPGDSDVQLILKSDKVDYILCILNKSERVQMPLNLIFSEGDEISFRSVGGTVHLTGYLVDEQNLPEYEEDESSDEDVPTLVDVSKQKGKRQVRQESSGSENEDSAESGDEVGSDDEEDVEDEMEADSDNESDEEIEEPPAKVPKTNGMPNGVSKKEDKNKDKKKDAKQKKQQQQQQRQTVEVAEEAATDSKASSHQDLKIEEIREGKGAEVKMGRKVQVYYEGRFKSNNKIFDKATSGKGFEFTVGRGSVIRGWDVGVLGMRAGGKRRLICSPSMAYGKKGSPPAIPPNATLVFDIEIKHVH